MLNQPEKAYFQALLALKRKDYLSAARFFAQAAPTYEDNKEFRLIRETNQLLLEVKKELGRPNVERSIVIEEMFSNG